VNFFHLKAKLTSKTQSFINVSQNILISNFERKYIQYKIPNTLNCLIQNKSSEEKKTIWIQPLIRKASFKKKVNQIPLYKTLRIKGK